MANVTNNEAQALIESVKQHTGYGVVVDSATDMDTYSDMTSATPDFPRHLIRVNQKVSKTADYLVAIQCAMILCRWSPSGPMPRFAVRNDKLAFFMGKLRNDSKLKKLPADMVDSFVSHLANGLLQQLCSAPAELVAAEMCFALCPSLHDQQIETINRNLREMTEALAPRIREMSPATVFEKNASMNSAYALWWAEISGQNACVMPFATLGFEQAGRQLLDAYNKIPPDDEKRVYKVTDAWAETLKLATLYKWVPVREE